MALASLTLSACVNETLEPTPSQKKGKEIFFEGSFSKSSTATKVEFQDAVDGIHALTWSEDGYIRIYDVDDVEEIVSYLMENGHVVSEVRKNKIGLEEYYIELMSKQGGKR